jgi:hypothetical protein
MALKTWDEYVSDAGREPIELAFKRSKVTIGFPNDEAIKAFNVARFRGDTEAALKALFGETNGTKIYEDGKGKAYGALDALMNDVLDEFGLRPGKSAASSS